MNRSIVILPDLQFPYHDKKFVDAMVRFIWDFQPDEVVQAGDFTDQPQPSKWSRGRPEEYEPTLYDGIKTGVAMLDSIRSGFDGRIRIKAGNHDRRIEEYVEKYAPAIRNFPELKMEALLEIDEYEVEYERDIFDIAPGWACAHGDEGPLSPVPGKTAMQLAARIGKSVVCGHTHRAGIVANTTGFGGKFETTFGMEVGHAMDLRTQNLGNKYLRNSYANWQMGLGLLHVVGRKVHPQLILAQQGEFVVDGVSYK